MNLRRHDCPVTQKPNRNKAFFNWGRCPQTPGIYRIPARMAAAFLGAADAAPPRWRALPHSGPLGRRSGRIPALPYPLAQVKPV